MTFAVARTCAVPKLPTFALPDTPNVPVTLAPVVVAVILVVPATPKVTFPPAAVTTTFDVPFCSRPLLIVVMLPVVAISVAVPKLPVFALPVAFNVPVMFAPVAVITTTFAVPAISKLMLPLAAGILTSLVPFARLPMKLAAVTLPVTAREVNVPTLVMFGCAAVVTVPAVVALVAAPLRAPTKVVAVIELFDRLAIKPVLVTSATLPVAAFAKTRKLFPVPAAALIKSVTFAYATFKLATRVVDVTTNGAVPVATFEISWGEVTFAVARTRAVPKLPTLALPEAFNVPAMFAPVAVTTITLAVPLTERLMLPAATGMLTFELPFTIVDPGTAITPVILLPSP